MLEVLEAGGLVTVQDAGRIGWRRFGVPAAGPMDRFAFQAANLLAGNPAGAAALEVGAGEVVLRAQSDCVLAVTGAGYQLSVNLWDFALWESCFVRGGWTVRLARSGFGMWAYVAVAGGLDVRPVLGSGSTYLRGRFGGLDGRPVGPGDVLKIAHPPRDLLERSGRSLPEEVRPAYGPSPTVDVIAGPQKDLFSDEEREAFYNSAYRLSASSDRMGYRLEGAALKGPRAELTSEGMTAGSIQVPSDGQPIAMMADCATTGGYPKIACVTSASAPLLAQCTPGVDDVRFREVSVESAQAAYRQQIDGLKRGIIQAED